MTPVPGVAGTLRGSRTAHAEMLGQPAPAAMLARWRVWEDLLTLIVDPQSPQVHNRVRAQRLLESMLQGAAIPADEFWRQSPARRSRSFLSRFGKGSRGLEPLEVTSFDLDRAVKERFRSEPLTIGAAWHHGFWRSYFSHAAITHPANDGLREEFSTAWEVSRREPVLVQRGAGGEQVLDVPCVRFDLPILVGPLPHSDGITLERAYIDAIARSDPGEDLRTSTRVVVTSAAYRAQRAFYRSASERILVRVEAGDLGDGSGMARMGGWELADELADSSRMLEIAVEPGHGPRTLHDILERLHVRHPRLVLSVFLRFGPEFWPQLLVAARALGVAMVHIDSGSEKSYRLIPAVDAWLKQARLRARVALVSAGGDSDTIASAANVYEAVLLGANAGSIAHVAELALAPEFAEVFRGADAAPVLEAIRRREPRANADLASSTLTCWQHSILDFLSCMGIDDVQKTSGNNMAITWTLDWLREVDALATPEFARTNRAHNLQRLGEEPVPEAERANFRVSRLLPQVVPDLELVAAAKVLAHRNANYHLHNTNQSLGADHLHVLYRMAAGRFPEVDDFFVEGNLGPLSLDGIGLNLSRQAVEASLQALRRDPAALDYINLCVPRGFQREGAVPTRARCALSLDAVAERTIVEFQADATGGFEVPLSGPVGDGTLFLVVLGKPDETTQPIALHPVDAASREAGGHAMGAPAGLSVRKASADHRIVLRETASGLVLEGTGVREPIYSGPVHHASISLGAASEDMLLARIEGSLGLALTSSGEGGPLRLPGAAMRWESLQAASAHFGITAADLRAVRDVEIKINQGAKPGKGGRLAGPKVTPTVSRARNIPVGTNALSPDPKHDIYSIEDMPAEVWLWLHFGVHCGIKITGSTYTRYVAAGMWSNFVVDYLLVDAGLGGSGNYHADSSRVGWPDVFRTILHTHHALMHEPLTDAVTGRMRPIRDGNGSEFGAAGGTKLFASGGLRGELDMLKVMIAGADGLLEASIGKAVAFGCNQCGNCHLDCPRGGITTKAELTIQNDRTLMRQRFRNWSVLNLVKLAVLLDAINREHGWVDANGQIVQRGEVLDDIRKLRGRTDLLQMPEHEPPQPPLVVPALQAIEAELRPEAEGETNVAESEESGFALQPPEPAAAPAHAGAASDVRREHDSCRVGSLLASVAVDVDAIWEAARLSHNGGNNRGGGIGFAGFAPEPVRMRTCLVINTIGPDRAETLQRIFDHCDGLRFFDAQGREIPLEEVRLRVREFQIPVAEAFRSEDGWRQAGLRENPGDMTLLFTELRGDALWRYGRQLLASPDWLQRRAKYGHLGDDVLVEGIERAVRRDEPFEDAAEQAHILDFLRDVKEEYYTVLAHVVDTRYYRTGLTPRYAAKRSGFIVSMGQDMACIKISGWTHAIPAYFDFAHFWGEYPGARERGGVLQAVRGETTWTTTLHAHVWGMHHRYPTNSPAIDAEGRGNPAGAHPFKGYNILLMHNGEQVGVDATAAMLTEHGTVHVDSSMGEGAEEYAGSSFYERKALTDTEYAAYLVDFTRRVLGLRTDDATQVISPITGIDLDAVQPPELQERYRRLARNYVQLTPTGPYKFTILEARPAGRDLHVGFRENMDIKFLRPHEIAVNWDSADGGVRVVANGSEAKIADAMLEVLRQKGILADAGADLRFNMRPGAWPGTGEMGGVVEAFLEPRQGELRFSNRFGEPIAVHRAGTKLDPLRTLATAITGARPQAKDEASEQMRRVADDASSTAVREACVAWVLSRLRDWTFDEFRHVVEWELPRLALHTDAHRDAALWILTELRKRVQLADGGGKSLATLQYFVDGGLEYDGEPEGGIYRLLHAVPGLWETRGTTDWGRIRFDTRLDLAGPEREGQVLVIDMDGFKSEAFGRDGAARCLTHAVELGWKRIVLYNCRGGPRYLGTNLADRDGQPAAGVRIDLYGRQSGDFLGALLEGAEIHCYGQGQSHVGMKADRGSLFILQDILNTGFYAAHGGSLSVWDSGSRFAVAGQNRVFEADGVTYAPGLRSIHFGSPNEYAFEYLMSGGENSLHVVMGLDKPDARGQLQLRHRPYAGKFFMSGAAAGRVFVFDPERRMQAEQFRGNESQRPTRTEWETDLGPFLAAEAAKRGLPLQVEDAGLRILIDATWRDYVFDEAFTKLVPIQISRAAQRHGESPPALVGMLAEM